MTAIVTKTYSPETKADLARITRIAARAEKLMRFRGFNSRPGYFEMVLRAYHFGIARLDLSRMEFCEDRSLMHDVNGITQNLDHERVVMVLPFLPENLLQETE